MPNNQTKQGPACALVRNYLAAHRNWSDQHHRARLQDLNRFHHWLTARGTSLEEATRSDCDLYMTERCKARKSSSAHKEWQTLRHFYQWAIDDGCIDAPRGLDWGPMQKVTAPAVDEPDPARQRVAPEAEYEVLMKSWDKRKLIDCRNAAMASLMYRTGLRSIEVSRCDVDRLDLTGDVATIEVLGKGKNGGKWRKVPLAAETRIWVERYLARLGADRPETGALFLATWSGKLSSVGRMNERAIRDSLEKRCTKLGLTELRSHQFRRAAAINARARKVNDQTIITVFGWEDGRMLKWYTRQADAQLALDEFAASDPTAAPAGAIRRGGRLRRVS